jgi:hypothetical protein
MQRWEYLTIYTGFGRWHDSLGREGNLVRQKLGDSSWQDPSAILNDLGEQGWELTGVIGGDTSSYAKLILKRPRR